MACAYTLGSRAAACGAAIGAAYVVVMIAGVAQYGFDVPIGDPILAIMEVLTLLSAPALFATMTVVHHHAPENRKPYAVLALGFTGAFMMLTCAVHFVALTAGRQSGEALLVWPSTAYALELLAWDWFLGLGLLCASKAFSGSGIEKAIHRTLLLGGALALLGTVGPLLDDMRLQRIGIAGYAIVLPVALALLARFFGSRVERDASA